MIQVNENRNENDSYTYNQNENLTFYKAHNKEILIGKSLYVLKARETEEINVCYTRGAFVNGWKNRIWMDKLY